MIDNETIEKKQNYLRREILDKGYSPDDFTNFVKKIKGEEGADLNSWSLEELYYVVPQFQEAQEYEKQNNDQNSSNFNEKIQQDIEYFGNEDEDLWGNKIKKTKIKKINCLVKCKKMDNSKLINKKEELKIEIISAEIKKDGLFSSSYYEFTIKNELKNIEIKRKMNDFFWLKKKLPSTLD